jgi:hypothetical protein
MRTILHLCADIGSDSKPYADAGYNVIKIGSKIGVENFSAKGLTVHGVIANPVCTHFSIARALHGREPKYDLVRECQRVIAECNPKWWVIENPATGSLKEYLGKAAMTYEPWEYGSPWSKRTALWGNFNTPPKIYARWEDVPKLPDLYTRPNRQKPSLAFMHKSHVKLIPEFSAFNPETDSDFRSLCSQHFAIAFMRANP